MQAKIVAIIGFALSMYASVPAIVIHNHAEEKESGVRTVSGEFDEDYLFMGQSLHFAGSAEDVLFLGKELTFSGSSRLGLIALAKDVTFSGSSGNGIMAGAMNVVVDGAVKGNTFAGCKSFRLSETGTIRGSLFVGCARLVIDGALDGNLYAGAGEIVINSEINGNVTVYGGRLVIGENGKINGNLTYSAKEKLSESEFARVTGTIILNEKALFEKPSMMSAEAKRSFKFFFGLAMFVSFAVTGCLLLFVPAFASLDTKQTGTAFWKTALWGLIPLLMYPAIVILSFVMVVTIPFGFVLLLAGIPLLFVAHVIGTTMAGSAIATALKWNVQPRQYRFLIGALAGAIVSILPFVNFLAFVFVSALGYGAYLSFLFRRESGNNESV